MSKCLALLFLCSVAARADDSWLRLKSEHFEVLTDAGAGSGREVLRRLEQIRHVFEARTNRSNLTPLPVRVFVFRSERSFEAFQVHREVAGYFQPGMDRDYIAMQVSGAGTYRVVYHEYTHLLLRHAGYRVPVWFNEGIAELFSTADVGKEEVRVGDLIPAHVLTLRARDMLDLQTLTTVDHESPHYNERGKSGIFYAQSWALVHMLNFAPEYRSGVGNFVEMILGGEDAVGAFRQAFGKAPNAVIQDLKAYLASGRFEGLRFRASKFDARKLTAEPLPAPAAQLALADLLTVIGKTDQARALYGKLEAAYPENSEVLMGLGQFAVRTEDFGGARQYLERAIAAGTSSARLFYDYAVVLWRQNEPEMAVVQNLGRSVELDSRFFEGHQLLGHLHLQADRLTEAILHLRRAAELQPGRVAVWESLAIAHHKAGSKEDARAAAKAARRAASGPEELSRIDALLDLLDSDADKIVLASPPQEKAKPAATPASPQVDGMLSQVDCLGSKARLHVTTPGGKILLLVKDAGAVRLSGIGRVDTTLACGQSSPRPVIVEYRTEAHTVYGTAGVVTSIQFR